MLPLPLLCVLYVLTEGIAAGTGKWEISAKMPTAPNGTAGHFWTALWLLPDEVGAFISFKESIDDLASHPSWDLCSDH